ncbi:MAG TPA: hypothetical protein GXX72_04485 [Clostridiaceae bacterium]|nr:hypothetical protein [Clostridiaceae bacterium]
MTDPRPDLKYDSQDWTKLLKMAERINKSLAITLHGFRCGGCRLHRGKRWVLRPDFDPSSSIWENQEEFEADRGKWLNPYKFEVLNLLKQYGKFGGEC